MKAVRINHIDKKKEKEGVLKQAGGFYTMQDIFYAFHACDSCMNDRALFKNGKKKLKCFCAFLQFFCFFFSFSFVFFFYPISALFQSFLKKSSFSLDALEQQCYNYLHVLYNLVIYIYMYKQVYVYKDRILIKSPQFRVMDIS